MTALKRKADASVESECVFPLASKKLKTVGDVHAVEHTNSTADDSFGVRAADAVDDSADDYKPSNAESGDHHADGLFLNISSHSRRVAHRSVPPASMVAKQRFLDEQVDFIILTRDNNKPDAYGAHSDTYGALPWSAIAKLYNQKYGVAITPAAMEKRARKHRSAWLVKHARYPTNIMYAKKPKMSRSPCPELVQREVSEGTQNGAVVTKHAAIGGWVPPDDVRNRADINSYIYHSGQVSESENAERIIIEVVDAREVPLGNVEVCLKDIRRSSAWYRRELRYKTEVRARLMCSSKVIVERYVQCISSSRLTEMTELSDLIDWNLTSLAELYCVAAQLQDNYVRHLVMGCWCKLFEQNTELDLDPEDLNLLFLSTEGDDPARDFWAAVVHASGVSDQLLRIAGCHTALISKVQKLVDTGPS